MIHKTDVEKGVASSYVNFIIDGANWRAKNTNIKFVGYKLFHLA